MSAPQQQPILNHLGLFEGIGGFSVAASWAGWKTKAWCEIDPYCQAVLTKNFPNSHGFGDIKKLTYATYKSVLRSRGDVDRRIDIITGGFPCQPVSTAGNRKGADDNRWLWPEMRRVIREFKPRVFVAENVAGLFSILEPGSITEVESKEIGLFCSDETYEANETIERVQRRVIATIIEEIRAEGYALPTLSDGTPVVLCLPACSVGAPHRRDRVWIVAYATGVDDRGNTGTVSGKNGRQKRHDIPEFCGTIDLHGPNGQFGANPDKFNGHISGFPASGPPFIKEAGIFENNGHGRKSGGIRQADECGNENCGCHWAEHWLQVATRICRVDDGIPRGLDGIGGLQPGAKAKSKAAGRGHRLKALGNAIVPQVAFEIFKAIGEFERSLFNQE